jgi:hypothetical protein
MAAFSVFGQGLFGADEEKVESEAISHEEGNGTRSTGGTGGTGEESSSLGRFLGDRNAKELANGIEYEPLMEGSMVLLTVYAAEAIHDPRPAAMARTDELASPTRKQGGRVSGRVSTVELVGEMVEGAIKAVDEGGTEGCFVLASLHRANAGADGDLLVHDVLATSSARTGAATEVCKHSATHSADGDESSKDECEYVECEDIHSLGHHSGLLLIPYARFADLADSNPSSNQLFHQTISSYASSLSSSLPSSPSSSQLGSAPSWSKQQSQTLLLHCEMHTRVLKLEVRIPKATGLSAVLLDTMGMGSGTTLSQSMDASTGVGAWTHRLACRRRRKRRKKEGRGAKSAEGADSGERKDAMLVGGEGDEVDDDENDADDSDGDNDDEMMLHDGIKRWYTLDCGGQLQASVLLCVPVTAANVRLGLRVERGPHWTHGDQDGGRSSLGTVVGYSLPADDDPNRKMKYGVSSSSMPVLHAVVKWDRPPINTAAAAIAQLNAPLPNEAVIRDGSDVTDQSTAVSAEGGTGLTRSATGCRAHYPIGIIGANKDTTTATGAGGQRRSSVGSSVLSPANVSSEAESKAGNGALVYALAIANKSTGGTEETQAEEVLAAATVELEKSISLEKQRAAAELQQVRKEAQGWLKQNRRLSQMAQKDQKEANGRLKREEMRAAEANVQLAREQREKERQRTEKRKQEKALQHERHERQTLEKRVTEGDRKAQEDRKKEVQAREEEEKKFERQQQEQHRQLRTIQGQLREAKQQLQRLQQKMEQQEEKTAAEKAQLQSELEDAKARVAELEEVGVKQDARLKRMITAHGEEVRMVEARCEREMQEAVAKEKLHAVAELEAELRLKIAPKEMSHAIEIEQTRAKHEHEMEATKEHYEQRLQEQQVPFVL